MSTAATSGSDASRPSAPAMAERVYRVLLRVYPPAFRAEYAREMMQLFRDQWREDGAHALRFWGNLMWDVAQSAPTLRMEAWRARGCASTRTMGVIMKLFAILIVLLGVFAALGAAIEGVMGMRHGELGTAYLLAVVLGAVAGALLLVAGVAVLRGAPSAERTASRAAIASLVVFLLARLLFGWMSIFTQLVGIGLPLVILATLHWRRSGPQVA